MRKFALFALLILVVGFHNLAQSEFDIISEEVFITVDDIERLYILTAPVVTSNTEEATNTDAYPVVFVMHGLGGAAEDLFSERLEELALEETLLVVYPQALPFSDEFGAMWQVDDIAYFEAILDDLRANFLVDESRIYMFGYSGGGVISQYVGAVLSDTFAAVGSIAGIMPNIEWTDVGGLVAEIATITNLRVPERPSRPMPIFFIHGTNDLIVPYEGARRSLDLWSEWNNCGEPEQEPFEESLRLAYFSECDEGVEMAFISFDSEEDSHLIDLEDLGIDTIELVWEFLSQFTLEEA